MAAEHIDYLGHLRAESARFLEVLEHLDPTTPVPTCPDWTADDLLWHLGEVQWFWATIVRERVQDPNGLRDAERPSDHDGVVAFFRANSSRLLDALGGSPPDTEVWTWFPDGHSVGFLRRRQAHEALIHRLDAEATAGLVTGLDTGLAVDGVAEVLETMYSIVPRWAAHDVGATGRVTVTDTGATWLVRIGCWSGTSPRDQTVYTDRPSITIVDEGEPTFEVSGRAGDLDAWLWNRPADASVTIRGDGESFVAAIRTGVH